MFTSACLVSVHGETWRLNKQNNDLEYKANGLRKESSSLNRVGRCKYELKLTVYFLDYIQTYTLS